MLKKNEDFPMVPSAKIVTFQKKAVEGCFRRLHAVTN